MLLTLNIDKDLPSVYTARVCHGSDVIRSTTHDTIAEAIATHGVDPVGDAFAFHIWYGTVSIGTIGVYDMRQKAEELATDLVQRAAMVYAGEDAA